MVSGMLGSLRYWSPIGYYSIKAICRCITPSLKIMMMIRKNWGCKLFIILVPSGSLCLFLPGRSLINLVNWIWAKGGAKQSGLVSPLYLWRLSVDLVQKSLGLWHPINASIDCLVARRYWAIGDKSNCQLYEFGHQRAFVLIYPY